MTLNSFDDFCTEINDDEQIVHCMIQSESKNTASLMATNVFHSPFFVVCCFGGPVQTGGGRDVSWTEIRCGHWTH